MCHTFLTTERAWSVVLTNYQLMADPFYENDAQQWHTLDTSKALPSTLHVTQHNRNNGDTNGAQWPRSSFNPDIDVDAIRFVLNQAQILTLRSATHSFYGVSHAQPGASIGLAQVLRLPRNHLRESRFGDRVPRGRRSKVRIYPVQCSRYPP